MYVNFIFSLVVFSLAFKLLNIAVAIGAAPIYLLTSRFSSRINSAFEFSLQVFICTTFGAMISAITLSYTDDKSIHHKWIYLCTGFVFTLIALAGNAAEKDHPSEWSYNPEYGSSRPAVAGASWGTTLGLALFAVLYVAPFVASWLPGLIPCVDVLFKVANWLVSFRLLRWAIGLYATYLVLGWILMLFSLGTFGIGSLLSSLRPGKKAAKPPEPVNCNEESSRQDDSSCKTSARERSDSNREVPMSKAEMSKLFVDYLAEEGYRPSTDTEGDVFFKSEGQTYYISIDANDGSFFSIGYFNFWSIDDEKELAKAFEAASLATAGTKVAKVFVRNDKKNVIAAVELFVNPMEDFKRTFSRALSALRAAVERFAEEMRRELPVAAPMNEVAAND